MRDGKRRKSVISLLVLVLLLTPFPTVHAQGGNVLIQDASVGLENYSTHLNSSLNFTFEVHELSGQSSNVSAEVLLQSPEGVVLSNSTMNVPTLSGFEQANLTASINGLPFGFSHITVTLTGDVGENTSSHVTSFTRVIQRLRPLNVSFGGSSSVFADAVYENGTLVGNTTLSDGDFVRFESPLINQGDVNWSGQVSLHLVNGGFEANLTNFDVSVAASDSVQMVFYPNITLVEGTLSWELSLSGNLSSAGGVHALSGSFPVGPPPLPVLSIAFASNVDDVASGDELTVVLTVWNNGTDDFNGRIVCFEDGNQRLNASMEVLVGENRTSSLLLTAKPMVLQCDTEGQRVSELSMSPSSLIIDLPSAIFEAAGSPSPSFSGGPWHNGDNLHGNMLLRNTGALDGKVRLGFTIDGIAYSGEWVNLAEGAAGEVSAIAPFLDVGETEVLWWLESDDGLIEGISSGDASFSIAPKQSVTLTITDVKRSNDGSVEAFLTVELDEGRAREVLLRTGYETGDATVFLREQVVMLEPGILNQSLSFGEINGEQLVASVTAVDWSIGPGRLSVTSTVPSEMTEFWMTFDPVTDPLRPLVGDLVSVKVTFSQSGPQSEERGELWLVDAYGSLLSRTTSPVWGGGSETSMTLDVTWPKGSTVALRAVWSIDGESVTEEVSYISGQPVVESEVQWPIGAMALGIALGAALVLGARLRFRSEPSTKPQKSPSASSRVPPTPATKDEKREISCPSCDRRLRVPVAYSGSVGCPDCSTKFPVSAEPTPPEPAQNTTFESTSDEVNEEEVPATKKEKNDGKVELSCPDCDQTLRIPASYRGSVRCPACTKIFKAGEGFTLIE